MAARRPELVVLGGSAGAIEVLAGLLPSIAPGCPAAVACVVHLPPDGEGLAATLAARCRVPVSEPADKDEIVPGRVFLAPPGYHLLVGRDRRFALSIDAPVHHARPSLDVLFLSAADAYGPRCVGIVLSGANADGAAGLRAIRRAGGRALVQAPEEAASPYMPEAAGRAAAAEVLAVASLRHYLADLGGPTSR
jgi:two-component system, chemotaxis family, protein-glutamate methylesterase/glutaminase